MLLQRKFEKHETDAEECLHQIVQWCQQKVFHQCLACAHSVVIIMIT